MLLSCPLTMADAPPLEKLSKTAIERTIQQAADLTHFPVSAIQIGDQFNIVVSTPATTDRAVIREFLNRANPFFLGHYDLAVRSGK